MSNTRTPDNKLLAIAPVFFVADIHRAASYYRDMLGLAFDRLWGEPPNFCMVRRQGLTIMLKAIPDKSRIRPNGAANDIWDAYLWIEDADALYAEFASRGAKIHYPPEDRLYYGNREFAVSDPDGYVTAFGHDIEAKKKRMG